MENLKKISAILILFTIVLALSAANATHALGVTATVTVGNLPGAVAYDSAKGEIFVANEGVISGTSTVSAREKSSSALAALLNSTFAALFYEFSGRYIENRDKTISNEIKIYELREIPCIDPAILEKGFPEVVSELEDALKSIETQEVKPLFEEIKSPQRQLLDEIVLCKILGLTKTEMREICNTAGELFRQRIERFSEKESAS
jgi:hypothetical protein